MKLLTLLFPLLLLGLPSCSSNSSTPPNSGGSGTITRSIQNTASTVGIVRNIQSIFQGF